MSEWTPPERAWIAFDPVFTSEVQAVATDEAARVQIARTSWKLVSYVPESVVDALREENARLREERDRWEMRADFARMADEEYAALRARVEELEAGLREAREAMREAVDDFDEAILALDDEDATVEDAKAAARVGGKRLTEALPPEFGGSQEPRPDTPNISTSPGGIASERQVEPDGLPNRSSYGPDAPPGEASRSLYSSSQEPRPDTDETLPYPWLTIAQDGRPSADVKGTTPAEADRRMVIVQELASGRLVLGRRPDTKEENR